METFAISLADLLANIGGIMGLLTGASLYTFIRYVEDSTATLYASMKIWANKIIGHTPAE